MTINIFFTSFLEHSVHIWSSTSYTVCRPCCFILSWCKKDTFSSKNSNSLAEPPQGLCCRSSQGAMAQDVDNLLRLPFQEGFEDISRSLPSLGCSMILGLGTCQNPLSCVWVFSAGWSLRIRAVAKAQPTLNFFLRLFYQNVIFAFPDRTAVVLLQYLL